MTQCSPASALEAPASSPHPSMNETLNSLCAGSPVRITRGNLAGLTGKVVAVPDDGKWTVQISSMGGGVFLRVSQDVLESAH